jgi:hypothetical protein
MAFSFLSVALLLSMPLLCAQSASQTGAEQVGTSLQRKSSGAPTLQDGTPVKLQLRKSINSKEAKNGDQIPFEVEDDVAVDGITILRRGSVVFGVVTGAQQGKRVGRAGQVSFNIPEVILADGEKIPLRSTGTTMKGESRTDDVIVRSIAMPIVAAPFFLLMKGGESSITKGREIVGFVNGDVRLDVTRFPSNSSAK